MLSSSLQMGKVKHKAVKCPCSRSPNSGQAQSGNEPRHWIVQVLSLGLHSALATQADISGFCHYYQWFLQRTSLCMVAKIKISLEINQYLLNYFPVHEIFFFWSPGVIRVTKKLFCIDFLDFLLYFFLFFNVGYDIC